MDYKEKYKLALKKAEEFYANRTSTDYGIKFLRLLEELFPELRESEDERMQELIENLLRVDTIETREIFSIYGKTADDVRAYLEKQKGQKPVVVIPKFRVGDIVVSKKNPRQTYNILEVGHINELNYPEYKVEIFTDGKAEEPANIKYIEIRHMDEWGELIEQKPAEWSEEDEKMVQFWNMYYEHKVGDWPNKDVVEHIERFKEWINNRFKSLRPEPKGKWAKRLEEAQARWKPSDEQMAALAAAKIGIDTDHELLESLYEQLKALK